MECNIHDLIRSFRVSSGSVGVAGSVHRTTQRPMWAFSSLLLHLGHFTRGMEACTDFLAGSRAMEAVTGNTHRFMYDFGADSTYIASQLGFYTP